MGSDALDFTSLCLSSKYDPRLEGIVRCAQEGKSQHDGREDLCCPEPDMLAKTGHMQEYSRLRD